MTTVRGRVCVVTGAGSGIGAALARAFAREGGVLALSDVDGDAVRSSAADCVRIGARAQAYELDVSDRAAVLDHAARVPVDLGPAGIVVNNAGVGLGASVLEMSWEDLDWLIGVDLMGVIHGTKAFLPQLIQTNGHLVNVSSVYGFVGVPRQTAYNAAKFGVRGFTEGVRQEMRAYRLPVTVSCVHPGGVRTSIARNARVGPSVDKARDVALFDRVARTTPDQAAAAIVRGIRSGRGRILVGPDARIFAAASRATHADGLLRVMRRLGLG